MQWQYRKMQVKCELLFMHKKAKQLRIDRNFCSVHEEITLIKLYTPDNIGLLKGVSNESNKIISINPYKSITTFLAMILKNIFIFSK